MMNFSEQQHKKNKSRRQELHNSRTAEELKQKLKIFIRAIDNAVWARQKELINATSKNWKNFQKLEKKAKELERQRQKELINARARKAKANANAKEWAYIFAKLPAKQKVNLFLAAAKAR